MFPRRVKKVPVNYDSKAQAVLRVAEWFYFNCPKATTVNPGGLFVGDGQGYMRPYTKEHPPEAGESFYLNFTFDPSDLLSSFLAQRCCTKLEAQGLNAIRKGEHLYVDVGPVLKAPPEETLQKIPAGYYTRRQMIVHSIMAVGGVVLLGDGADRYKGEYAKMRQRELNESVQPTKEARAAAQKELNAKARRDTTIGTVEIPASVIPVGFVGIKAFTSTELHAMLQKRFRKEKSYKEFWKALTETICLQLGEDPAKVRIPFEHFDIGIRHPLERDDDDNDPPSRGGKKMPESTGRRIAPKGFGGLAPG